MFGVTSKMSLSYSDNLLITCGWFISHTSFFLKKDFLYLFLERREGREKDRERTSMCGCPLHAPYRGPGLQPRHVPWLGIEPMILCFTDPCLIHWVTSARAISHISLSILWPAAGFSKSVLCNISVPWDVNRCFLGKNCPFGSSEKGCILCLPLGTSHSILKTPRSPAGKRSV